MAKLRFTFDEEEKEEKIGWSQRTRGIGELPKYKPVSTKLKFTADVGIGAKAVGGIKLPEKPEEKVISVKPEEEDFSKPLARIKYYKSKIDWLESIAKEKGGLGESGYDAYEYSIRKYNEAIDEHNIQAKTKYKYAFRRYKQETGLPGKPGYYTPLISGFKKVEDTKLSAYKEPEKNVIDKIKESMLGIFKEKPETQIAKAQVSYNISQKTGIPITEIDKNLDKYSKALGIRGMPTGEEFLSAMFVFPITAAIISNPISAGIGITKFLALSEAENLIISKAKGWKYQFGAGKGLKELTPEDTNQITKDILDVVDFVAKGVIIGATDKGTKAMWQKFTKDVIETHSPSQKIYLSSKKIKDLHLHNPKLATQFEKDVYANLGGKAEAVRTAFQKGGIDVEIPSQTITKIADKPYWVAIKSLFNIKSFSKTVISNIKGKWTEHPAGLLPGYPTTVLRAGVTPGDIVESVKEVGNITKDVATTIKNMKAEEFLEVAKGLGLEPGKLVQLIKEREIEKPEEIIPTILKALEPLAKESIELKKVIEIKNETEKAQKKLIDEKVLELKEEGFKGVEKGGLKRDEESKVIGAYPRISLNPKWYRDFYAEHKKSPTLTDLKEIAKEQLSRGHTEDYGEVPANDIFVKIEAQLESYDTIIDTLKEGKELTPKIINKIKSGKLPIEISKILTAEEKYPERFAKQEIKEFKKFITEEEEEFIKIEREYPAKIVKEEVEELKPLATPAQIKKAHAIADSKAMISEKGKVKPQYRKIAETFTGKKSIKDMTTEEAEMFIDQLNRLPEPKYKGGKLVAPSIPRTMKLVTQDFFKKKYGEPTPIWLLTDQTYYATKLGIKPLIEPFEKGKQEFDLEFRLSSNLVDRMVNKLNAIAKTPGFERIKSKVKNIPTKAESNMASLLNKYEAMPPGLTEKEEDIFKYFRNLSKDIWRRENEVREKVDLPPIRYKTAYFRHIADAMAKEMLEGKYPFPQGIKYWSEKMVGKKIFNPMEFQRKLSDDLIDIWSKDIRAVIKAMLWNGLKEIYLAQPAKFLNEQLNAISKDLPEYKNLTPREKMAYDQTKVMPASTRKWLVDYINQVIKGQETELDASLNRIVTKSGLKGIFDKVLSPFGRGIGRKPITNVFTLSGRAVISGVMGWVPRQIMRNSFQPVQNLALYGVKATIKAYLPASVDKNLKGLLSESLFLKSYTGYEELPTNLMAKLEKVWLGPYGIVAVNNAKLGMKAAYWNILELIKNPKFKKRGWADPQRTKDTPKGHLYHSEKEKLLKEMEFGSSATQYQYIPMGMPGIFRYKALIPLTRLQSWWMNYFTKFLREAAYRAFKGRPSWAGEDGPTLSWSRRVNCLKYIIIGGAILTALGYKRSFMLGVAPTYLSPAGQLALGMYNYAVADEDWKKKKALRQIYYSWKAFIPGSLAWRDFLAVWKGEKDLEEILFYGKKEKKKAQPPLKITIPKSGELKFTGPEIKIESNKLKFTF